MASANGAGVLVVDRDGVGARLSVPRLAIDDKESRGLDDPARKGVCARNDDEPRRAPRQERLSLDFSTSSSPWELATMTS